MCCRLKLSLREIHKRHGGLFGSGSLTGSIGVVTLNLPMLAYEAKGSRDKFYTNIEKYLEIASRSLEIKRDVIEAFTTQGLYPYTKTYLESSYARDKKYWGSHFSTIGLIGMYEAAVALGIDYTSAEGRKFAETVLKFMNRKLVYFQNTTGNFYNLEATPAEGASYKLALAAKKKYPDIFTSGVATPYFTNSTTLPVGHSTDIFKILEHQDTLQTLYSGGTVLHAYLGEKITGDQSKLMVKKILSNYKIPYLSITPTFSVCPAHGYLAGEHSLCPKCTEEKDTLINRIAQLKEELK
jgi:ribonucleoside-triphosphate reductase